MMRWDGGRYSHPLGGNSPSVTLATYLHECLGSVPDGQLRVTRYQTVFSSREQKVRVRAQPSRISLAGSVSLVFSTRRSTSRTINSHAYSTPLRPPSQLLPLNFISDCRTKSTGKTNKHRSGRPQRLPRPTAALPPGLRSAFALPPRARTCAHVLSLPPSRFRTLAVPCISIRARSAPRSTRYETDLQVGSRVRRMRKFRRPSSGLGHLFPWVRARFRDTMIGLFNGPCVRFSSLQPITLRARRVLRGCCEMH
ncbi:hypothetical protein BC628DRAFT_378139 [Trametes gibbosa]|nr:hypothetical protein BC628DRAFT_378139 [Trametes gibbosa]